MKVPAFINGYPVRAFAYRGAGSYYVLVERTDRKMHPWVAATYVGHPGWQWGHYCYTREEALDVYPDAVWIDPETLAPVEAGEAVWTGWT